MVIQLGLAACIAGGLVVLMRSMSSSGSAGESTSSVLVQTAVSMMLAGLLAVCSQTRAPDDRVLAILWGVFAAVVVLQVAIDLRTRTLPRGLSHAGLALIILLAVLNGSMTDLVHMVLGALLMTTITGVLVVISRGSLGIGDLHFSPLLGAAIGWYAPSLVVVAWLVASVSAAVIVLALLATRRISIRTRVPYGPFLAVGTAAAICIGAVR